MNDLLTYAKNGDKLSQEEIIKQNSGLIWSIVKRFTGRGTDAEDLYQLGCIGLLKAIDGFDESLGYQFSTYAVPKISGEIRRFLRDDGLIKVSRSIRETGLKIRIANERLTLTLGRTPVLSELAVETGFTPEEIAQAEIATATADSLDRELNDDSHSTLESTLASKSNEDDLLEHICLRQAISKLCERERMVIYLRFFKGLTQEKTSKILNISQVQVSRTERSAIKNLRGLM